ncbi:MAG: hypothetical protein HJJLKODD_01097 [Phycisphaerae bacterium]|nr:hypothetical protein [Phycisphaerae bacterium]
MVQITFQHPVSLDTQRGYTARCRAGQPYLLTQYHFRECLPAADYLDHQPYRPSSPYRRLSLGNQSLLILWLAGLGDTLTFAPALMVLQQQNPQARIDLLTLPPLFDIVRELGFTGQLLNYPATPAEVESYDYFLPLEELSKFAGRQEKDAIDFFAEQLGVTIRNDQPTVSIADRKSHQQLPDARGRRRIGVQVSSLSPLRTYPAGHLAKLLRLLVQNGDEVHLIGQAGDCDAPTAPPLLHNHCGQTPTFSDLVALVRQLDLLIAPDSYLMHLGGLLQLPTIALMSTIPARLRTTHYPAVTAIEPALECAPCMVVEDQHCPLGHPYCLAMDTWPLCPENIFHQLQQLLPAGKIRDYCGKFEKIQ